MSELFKIPDLVARVRNAAADLWLVAIGPSMTPSAELEEARLRMGESIDALADRISYQVAVPGCESVVGDHTYWRNAEGDLVALENVRPKDQLQDQVVRRIFGFVLPLSDQIARFREHTQADINGFVDLILQEYGTKRGGTVGNVSLTSFDDMYRVELRIAKLTQFDSDLLAAKQLSDECLAEWSEDSNANLRTIVRAAFQVDKLGRVNQQALLALLRHDIDDERWRRAMAALRDAIKVRVTKEHLYFFRRPAPGQEFVAVTVNLAKAQVA